MANKKTTNFSIELGLNTASAKTSFADFKNIIKNSNLSKEFKDMLEDGFKGIDKQFDELETAAKSAFNSKNIEGYTKKLGLLQDGMDSLFERFKKIDSSKIDFGGGSAEAANKKYRDMADNLDAINAKAKSAFLAKNNKLPLVTADKKDIAEKVAAGSVQPGDLTNYLKIVEAAKVKKEQENAIVLTNKQQVVEARELLAIYEKQVNSRGDFDDAQIADKLAENKKARALTNDTASNRAKWNNDPQTILDKAAQHKIELAQQKTLLDLQKRRQTLSTTSPNLDINALPTIGSFTTKLNSLTSDINHLNNEIGMTKQLIGGVFDSPTIAQLKQEVIDLKAEVTRLNQEALQKTADALNKTEQEAKQTQDALKKLGLEADEANRKAQATEKFTANVNNLKSSINNVAGAYAIFNFLSNAIRKTISELIELDKQFTEIAIVSNRSTEEMWKGFRQVNQTAQEYGVTTSNVVSVQKQYYQQGLDTAAVNRMTAETLTLAKISELDYADATRYLTAAIRGFKMEASDATLVTDTYAALASAAAADTKDIALAMSKTASIADNAGMGFQNTAVFLTKMIETTQESAENLGTAMKSIVARFAELKKSTTGSVLDEDGEMIDSNKVETALKTVGIALKNSSGEFRDLDDVFLELSAKWDTMDVMSQRYIATIAAGSRQQSRFIAMMSDYDRTIELMNVSQNAAGTGALQLNTALGGMESTINRLKSAWLQFTSSFLTSAIMKGAIDILTSIVMGLNAIIKAIGAVAAIPIITGLVLMIKAVSGLLIDTIASSIVAGYTKAQAQIASMPLIIPTVVDPQTGAITPGTFESKAPSKGSPERKKLFVDRAGTGNTAQKVIGKGTAGLQLAQLKITDKMSASTAKLTAGQHKNAIVTGIQTSAIGILSGVESVLLTIQSLLNIQTLIYIGIAAAVVGAIWLINTALEAENKKREKQLKLGEEISKQRQTYIDQLQNTISLEDKLAKYKELESKQKAGIQLSTEQLSEYNSLVKELTEKYPEMIKTIDEKGQYQLVDISNLDTILEREKERTLELEKQYNLQKAQAVTQGVFAGTNTATERSMQAFSRIVSRFVETDLDQKTGVDYEALRALSTSVDIDIKKLQQFFKDVSAGAISNEVLNVDLGANLTESEYQSMIADLGKEGSNFETVLGKYLSADKTADLLKINEETNGLLAEILQNSKGSLLEIANSQVNSTATDFLKSQGMEVTTAGTDILASYLEQQLAVLNDNNASFEQMNNYLAIIAGAKELPFIDLTSTDIEYIKSQIKNTSDRIEGNPFQFLENKKIDAYINEQLLKLGEDGIPATMEELLSLLQDMLNIPEIQNAKQTALGLAQVTQSPKYQEALDTFNDKLIFPFKNGALQTMTADGIEDAINAFLDLIDPTKALSPEVRAEIGKSLSAQIDTTTTKYDTAIKAISSQTGGNLPINTTLDADQLTTVGTLLDKATSKGKKGNTSQANATKALTSLINITNQASDTAKAFAEIQSLATATTNEGMIAIRQRLLDLGVSNKAIDEYINNSIDTSGLWRTAAKETADAMKTAFDSFSKSLQAFKAGVDGTLTFDLVQELVSLGFKSSAFAQSDNGGLKFSSAVSQQSVIDAATKQINETVATMRAQSELTFENSQKTDDNQREFDEAQQETNTLLALAPQLIAAQINSQSQKEHEELLTRFNKVIDILKGVNIFENLDAFTSSLTDRNSQIDTEVNLKDNASAKVDLLTEKVNNLTTLMAINEAKQKAAIDQEQKYANIAKQNFSDTLAIQNGVMIKTQKYYDLKEQLAAATKNNDTTEIKRLEALLKAIDDVEAEYSKAAKTVDDTTKARLDLLKQLDDFMKSQYQAVKTFEDKVIELVKNAEDKKLKDRKETFDALTKLEQEYLDDVRKMVDQERKIRDRTLSEDSLKDKKNRLAMLKMDSSGMYASEIVSLTKEITDEERTLGDQQVDNVISQLGEQNTARSEARTAEITAEQEVLDARRESMEYYHEIVRELEGKTTEQILAYLSDISEDYKTMTETAKILWKDETDTMIGNMKSAQTLITTELGTIKTAMEVLQNSEKSVSDEFGDFAKLVTNTQLDQSIAAMTDAFSPMIGQIESLQAAWNNYVTGILKDAATINATEIKVGGNVAGAEPYDPNLTGLPPANIVMPAAVTSTIEEARQNRLDDIDNRDNPLPNYNVTANGNEKYASYAQVVQGIKEAERQKAYLKSLGLDTADYKQEQFQIVNLDGSLGNIYDHIEDAQKERSSWAERGRITHIMGTATKYQYYKDGGIVNYTGPAWVDGSPSKPEAFLSSADVENIKNLTTSLKFTKSVTNPLSNTAAIQNAHINNDVKIEIHVDSIASDYDADRMATRIKRSILKDTRGTNINNI